MATKQLRQRVEQRGVEHGGVQVPAVAVRAPELREKQQNGGFDWLGVGRVHRQTLQQSGHPFENRKRFKLD